MVDVLLGLQWGDEGKGKIVDFLAKDYNIIARFQGGPNAGHTLYLDDKKVVLHTIPSGVFHEHITNVIGNGVVLDPISFREEAEEIMSLGVSLRDKLIISEKTHLILPSHKLLDKASEMAKGNEKIGSTLKGIGPTYMDKTGRNGIRVGDILQKGFLAKYEKLKSKHIQLLSHLGELEVDASLEKQFFEAIEFLKSFTILSTEYWMHNQLSSGKTVLAEGAQGTMLDIDFGTYPFVTSSNTISAGLCTGLGVSPRDIGQVFGISKAYCTRVGSGPFPTELHDQIGEELRKIGNEFGATTGRPRRCGWLDIVALRYACMINGVTKLIITKADILDQLQDIMLCTRYNIEEVDTDQFPYAISDTAIKPVYEQCEKWESPIAAATEKNQLPVEFLNYIEKIEKLTKVSVAYVSNGVGRKQLIAM